MVSGHSLREKTSNRRCPCPRALRREDGLSWFPLSLQDTRRRTSGLQALGWGALSLRQALFSGRWSLFQVGAGHQELWEDPVLDRARGAVEQGRGCGQSGQVAAEQWVAVGQASWEDRGRERAVL